MASKKPATDVLVHPIKKYQTLLTNAKAFFTAEKEKEYQPIVIFFLLYVLIGQVLEFVAWVPSLGASGASELYAVSALTVMTGIFGIFLAPLLTLLITFVVAGIIHLIVSYYKKGAPYFLTWKVIAYSTLIPIIYNVFSTILITFAEALNPWPEQSIYTQIPSFGWYYLTILSFLFLIGFVSLIHVLYTEIIGLALYHKLTTKQAAVAVLVPLLIILFFIILFAFALGSLIAVSSLA